jgi:predicted nucleic-acid-binding Zn-ribbon protein
MKTSKKCPKCASKSIRSMDMNASVSIDFGTYFIGDLVVPKLYVCLNCGYGECWIASGKDLDDIRKFAETRSLSEDEESSAKQ